MKIQELAIILIIIILPISIVLSVYTQYQVQAVNTQSDYDARLTAATYDAIKAFQINTQYDVGSDITNSKLEDLEASIKTFRNSLMSTFELKGYTEEDMNNYIPALVYTLYDGFYIYSPYENINYRFEEEKNADGTTKKDDDGNIQYDESKPIEGNGDDIYGLKPYISYSCRYKRTGLFDVVITYSLDNYITVQGTVKGEYVNRSGYLIDNIKYREEKEDYTIEYNGVEIENEIITEVLAGYGEVPYVKVNGTKYYYIKEENRIVYINSNGELTKQCEETLPNGQLNDVFIKMVGLIEDNNMAKEYYREAYKFKEWFKENGLNEIEYSDAYEWIINAKGEVREAHIWEGNDAKVFDFNDKGDYENNIENELSSFNQHRLSVIRHKIETNLAIAISNYNTYLGAESTSDVFQMPELKEDEWDYITHNISLISFLQGLPIGEKTYNGYTVVTNSESKEVVLEQYIYILGEDRAYHKIGDKYFENGGKVSDKYNGISKSTSSAGRLNLDFDRKRIQAGEIKYYYYPLTYFNASYSSIVMQDSMITYDDIYVYVNQLSNKLGNDDLKRAFYTAIGRERYGVYKMLSYVNINKITQNMNLLTISYNSNADGDEVTNMPAWKTKAYKETVYISNIKPERKGHKFLGWSTEPNGEVQYTGGEPYSTDAHLQLYAIWKTDEYEITYDGGLSGATNVPATQTRSHDGEAVTIQPGPTCAGHVFLYWRGHDGSHYYPSQPFKVNKDLHLTAEWDKLQNSVIFNANGGTGGPGNQIKTWGEDFTIPDEEPTREGYEFLGWNTDKNAKIGDPKYQADSTYKDDDSITLYAIWKLKEFTVSYNVNGGSGSLESQTKYYNKSLQLLAEKPTRSGYTFLGWATSKTGNVAYQASGIYKENASVTLYAQWEQATVKKTLKGSYKETLYDTWGKVYKDIKFSQEFVSPPTVTCYADAYDPNYGTSHTDGMDCFKILNLTTTGCTIEFSNYSHDGIHTIYWEATGEVYK